MPIQLNKSLRILFKLNSIFIFGGALLGPLFAIYVQKIDGRILSVSVSWTAFIASTVCFDFLVSLFGDKIKEKEYLLAAGFLVRSLAWISYLFVNNLITLIMVQICLGLGEALGTPAWNAIFAKHLDGHKEIMDYSGWNMTSNLMTALGTLVGGVIATYLGFNYIFIFMSILAFISFVGVLIIPRKEL